MRYLLVKDGVVKNEIIASSDFVAEHYPEYLAVESDGAVGSPGIGWSYDGTSFSPGVTSSPTLADKIADKKDAIAFAQDLMAEFAVITDERDLSETDRLALLSRLQGVMGLLTVGDLQTALTLLNSVQTDSLLPAQLLSAFSQKIVDYLAS